MKRISFQQRTKRMAKKCYFCPQDKEVTYAELDVHRIVPGSEGGKYTEINTLTVCVSHHRRIHDGQIVIDRKYDTTAGKTVLRYWENGEEKWL